jgi:hypothetical protein
VNPAQAWTPAELNDLRKEYREHSQKSLDLRRVLSPVC